MVGIRNSLKLVLTKGGRINRYLAKKEQANLNKLNNSFFVFAVNWNDYQFIDILMINNHNRYAGYLYSQEEELYIFNKYLKSLHKQKTFLNFNTFFKSYMTIINDEMADEDFTQDYFAMKGDLFCVKYQV